MFLGQRRHLVDQLLHVDLAFALAQSDSQVLLLSRSFRSNPYLEMAEALRAFFA